MGKGQQQKLQQAADARKSRGTAAVLVAVVFFEGRKGRGEEEGEGRREKGRRRREGDEGGGSHGVCLS